MFHLKMIKQLLLLFAVLSIVSAIPDIILGNHDAKLGQFPFHVSVQKSLFGEEFHHLCSGAIVRPQWVFTSARCYHVYYIYKVIAGFTQLDNTTNPESQQRSVVRFIVHPDFDGARTNYVHDIALLQLAEPLIFNRFVNQATLNYPLADGHSTITGWNLIIQPKSHYGNKLQFLYTSDTPEQKCSLYYPEHDARFQNCFGPLYEVCLGSHGDPLVQDGALVGIASYRKAQCNDEYPIVYTVVEEHHEFYEKYIDKYVK